MQEQELYDRQVNRMARIYRGSRVGTLIASGLSVLLAPMVYFLGCGIWVSGIMLICAFIIWFFSRKKLKYWDPSEYKNKSSKDLKSRGHMMTVLLGMILIAGGDFILVSFWFWKIVPDVGVCLLYVGVLCLLGAVPLFFIMKGYLKDAGVSDSLQIDVDYRSLTLQIPGVLTYRSKHSDENTLLYTAKEGKHIVKMFYITSYSCEEGLSPQKLLARLEEDFTAAKEWKNLEAAEEYFCAGMTAKSYRFRYSDTGGKAKLLMVPRPEAVYCLIFYKFSDKEFKRTVSSIKLSS